MEMSKYSRISFSGQYLHNDTLIYIWCDVIKDCDCYLTIVIDERNSNVGIFVCNVAWNRHWLMLNKLKRAAHQLWRKRQEKRLRLRHLVLRPRRRRPRRLRHLVLRPRRLRHLVLRPRRLRPRRRRHLVLRPRRRPKYIAAGIKRQNKRVTQQEMSTSGQNLALTPPTRTRRTK